MHDLCNYSDEATEAKFNQSTGAFTFNSTDIVKLGTQTVIFEITATSGKSTETYTFGLNLINPCLVAEFNIDPDIIHEEINYNVYSANSATVIPIDQALISVSHPSSLCPAYEIDIVKDDYAELDNTIFSFDTNSKLLLIDTRNPTHIDSYNLKLVANFEGDFYPQTGELPFKVNLVDYCADSKLTNPG